MVFVKCVKVNSKRNVTIIALKKHIFFIVFLTESLSSKKTINDGAGVVFCLVFVQIHFTEKEHRYSALWCCYFLLLYFLSFQGDGCLMTQSIKLNLHGFAPGQTVRCPISPRTPTLHLLPLCYSSPKISFVCKISKSMPISPKNIFGSSVECHTSRTVDNYNR